MDFSIYVACHLPIKLQVDTIYLNFSKAFDKAPHSFAIAKLHKLGLRIVEPS